MEEGFQKDPTSTSWPINSIYNADFQVFQQIKGNNRNYRRFIRRVVYCWFWKDDNEEWRPYSIEDQSILEQSYCSGQHEIELTVTAEHVPLKLSVGGGKKPNVVLPSGVVIPDSVSSLTSKIVRIIDMREMCQYSQKTRLKRRDICRVGPPLQKHILEASLKDNMHLLSAPSYWTDSPVHSIPIAVELSPDDENFKLIEKLMNTTIGSHGDKYGLVPGVNKDPKKFKIKKIIRIQDPTLWIQFAHAKIDIVNKYKGKLSQHKSSEYLRKNPLLVPIIDGASNEIYAFHGCAPDVATKIISGGFNERYAEGSGIFGGN